MSNDGTATMAVGDENQPELARLPDEIQRASKERRLILFLGAGISSAAGLPSWDTIKLELITKFRLRPDQDPSLRSKLHSMDLYDCFEAVRREDRTIYDEVVNKSLNSEQANMILFNKLLDDLRALQPVSFVTTNFDDLLPDSRKFRKDQFRYTDCCAAQELRLDKVFFLHGSREKNIFTSYDRDKLYGNEYFKFFLNNLFGSYCVLFLGFSFRDRELLRCATLSPDFARDNRNYVGHFALLPTDHKVPSDYDLLTKYGVRVFRYANNDGSHNNFASSIMSWNKLEAVGV
jgi:hypothetical protein